MYDQLESTRMMSKEYTHKKPTPQIDTQSNQFGLYILFLFIVMMLMQANIIPEIHILWW